MDGHIVLMDMENVREKLTVTYYIMNPTVEIIAVPDKILMCLNFLGHWQYLG